MQGHNLLGPRELCGSHLARISRMDILDLGVSDEGPEVDGPGGEEEGEDVGSGERREDDKRVSEVERRDGEQQPERIEREEGPGVEARRPVPPPQQVHALHRLAVHLEPRHAGAAAARIGESAAETPGLSDRAPMWISEMTRVEIWGRFTGSARLG